MTGRHEHGSKMVLMLFFTSGTYVTVAPGTSAESEQTFRNAVDALTGEGEWKLFRHVGTGGKDLGPIAVDMTKVIFISPMEAA